MPSLEELRIHDMNGYITERNLMQLSAVIRKFPIQDSIIKFLKSKDILHSVSVPFVKKKNLNIQLPLSFDSLDEIPEEGKGALNILQMKYDNSKLLDDDMLTNKEDSLTYLQFPNVKCGPKSARRDDMSTSFNENASVAYSCDNMNDITINNILLPSDLGKQMTFGKNLRRYQSTIVVKDKKLEEEVELQYNDIEIAKMESNMWIVIKPDVVAKKHGVLFNKSLYIYNDEEAECYQKIYYLFSLFIKEESISINDPYKKGIKVNFKGKEKTLIFENDKIKCKWLNEFKKIKKRSDVCSHYKLDGVIGKGSFGLVKLAYRVTNQERVAVKIIDKREATVGLGTLKMEIECMKLCNHPNICRLLEIYEDENFLYLVTEYLDGGNLRNYIKMNSGSISEKRIKQIFASLVSAVYYMQKIGIIHRDLKPENILLTDKSDSSEAKILDFGLATVKGPNQFSKDKVGTLSYIAPEIHEGKLYGKAVDIWSLGIILYFLLCGKLPFEGEAEKDKIK